MQGRLPILLPLYAICLLYQSYSVLPPGPSPGNEAIIHHTGADYKFFHKDFPGNFLYAGSSPIRFIRLRTISPALARSSAVKA